MAATSNIKKRLITSFFAVSAITPLACAIIIGTQFYFIDKYKAINEKLNQEYSLISTSSELIDRYNKVLQIQSPDGFDAYWATDKRLNATIAKLTPMITAPQTRLMFTSLVNVITGLEHETNTGVQVLASGQVAGTSQYYEDATNKLSFVNEIVSTLILAEIENGQAFQKNLDAAQQLGIILAVATTSILIILILRFSVRFSSDLSGPLMRLADQAKSISPTNLHIEVETKLLERSDEVGILARAFNNMVNGLEENVARIVESNTQLQQSEKDLKTSNEELSKFNNMVVNRELAMVKLKEKNQLLASEVERLGGKLPPKK